MAHTVKIRLIRCSNIRFKCFFSLNSLLFYVQVAVLTTPPCLTEKVTKRPADGSWKHNKIYCVFEQFRKDFNQPLEMVISSVT